MKNILIITLVLLLVSCAKNKKSDSISSISKSNALYVVDIDNITKESSIKFSSYFKDVKAIILETNEDCLISDVRSIRVVDDFIIVMDDKQAGSAFVFDKNGRFIRKFGKVGQGPGEYVDITDLSIDFNEKEVYISDFYSKKINKYDIESGEFISSVNINKGSLDSYFIQYLNNKIYASATPVLNTGDSFLLQEIDIKSGECINSYLRASEYNSGGNYSFLRREGFFYPNGRGDSKFVQMFMDTIVCIGNDSIKPFLALKTKNWITPKDVRELIECETKNNNVLSHEILFERKISYNIHRYFEIGNMIYFQYHNNGRVESVIYDKGTNTVRTTNIFLDDIVYSGDKVIFPLFTFADSKGVYSYLETEDMTRFIEIAHAGGLNPNIDKLDDLKKLPEDSNPVIFYYEHK